jgi:hypothetical protein
LYAPGAVWSTLWTLTALSSAAPSCGLLRADQTCLALFLFLHLNPANLTALKAQGIFGAQHHMVRACAAAQHVVQPEEGAKEYGRAHHNAKTLIVISILRVIPVAVGAANPVLIVVPRAAPHHASQTA